MGARRVLIVGGGIAGLATALGLRRAGVDVQLVELGTSWLVAGTGIIQQGNVVRAMASLGFNQEFLAAGFPFNRIRSYDPQGNLQRETVMPRLAGFDYPAMLGISRPALHQLLLAAATRAGTRIQLGVTVTELRTVVGGVHARFSDGGAQRYDVVIGADGLHSSVRAQLFGEAWPAQPLHQALWCAMLPRPRDIDCLLSVAGPRSNCGVCPLSASTMYLYVTSVEPDGVHYGHADLPALLSERLAPFGGPVARWREAISDPANVSYRVLESVLIGDDWHRGPVVLIGDAAHTCAPHLGQGAGMAIEDAVVIAEELALEQPVSQALQRFSERRRERVRRIWLASEQLAQAEVAGDPQIDRAALVQGMLEVTAQPI